MRRTKVFSSVDSVNIILANFMSCCLKLFLWCVVLVPRINADEAPSIKLELMVPGVVAEGQEAILGCSYQMENDMLYGIRWSKDGREFYQYLPGKNPQAKYFPTEGVTVDMTRSYSEVVTLVDVSAESAGVYGCEVTGEGPNFATAYDEKYIKVYMVSQSPPDITGDQKTYANGEQAIFNCSSQDSRPETLLRWFLNGQQVTRDHLQGPWYRVSTLRPDATITILMVKFIVQPQHFINGAMELKCQATIAPLYNMERRVVAGQDQSLFSSPRQLLVHEAVDQLSATPTNTPRDNSTTCTESSAAHSAVHFKNSANVLAVISFILLTVLNYLYE